MAKKKRTFPSTSPSKRYVSNTQIERGYVVAKKILREFEVEPEILDVFTKKQRTNMFGFNFEPPVVKAEKEKSVPQRYVKKIHEELFKFMRTKYWGNPENQLTYMDLAMYGVSFLMMASIYSQIEQVTDAAQREAAKRICAKYDRMDFFLDKGFREVLDYLHYLTRSYSQVNFRLYGFHYTWERKAPPVGSSFPTLKMKIVLTVQDCESKIFIHNNIERKAFRLIVAAEGLYDPGWAVVQRKLIFSKAKESEDLNIYIQSHALHRFKERIDILEPADRNFLIQFALTYAQKVVKTEKETLLSCLIDGIHPIGYFTFFVRDSDIVVKTFLPVVSENVPEGKKLHEILQLGKDDIVYLGLDKLSFYLKIDFEQIPTLKQALIDSNIWQMKLALHTMIEKGMLDNIPTIDLNKTMFVKSFFDKLEEHRL